MEELKEVVEEGSVTEKSTQEKNLETELKEWKDRALRYAAEIENLKKAIKREKEEYYKFALETVFKELLPSIDNLEMALVSCEKSSDIKALKEGVELSLKVLVQTLEKFGLKQFEPAVGEPFHPHFHEALHAEPHHEIPEGGIVRVFQKGYTLHDRVIRPALVCVCQGSPKPKIEESKVEKNSSEENNQDVQE